MLLSISAWALALISIAIACPGPRRSVEARFRAACESDRIISLLKYRFLASLFSAISKAFFNLYSLVLKTSFVFSRG